MLHLALAVAASIGMAERKCWIGVEQSVVLARVFEGLNWNGSVDGVIYTAESQAVGPSSKIDKAGLIWMTGGVERLAAVAVRAVVY